MIRYDELCRSLRQNWVTAAATKLALKINTLKYVRTKDAATAKLVSWLVRIQVPFNSHCKFSSFAGQGEQYCSVVNSTNMSSAAQIIVSDGQR